MNLTNDVIVNKSFLHKEPEIGDNNGLKGLTGEESIHVYCLISPFLPSTVKPRFTAEFGRKEKPR